MKLCEHPEFAALLVAAAQATDLNEQFVEKDYYVTEVLRIVVGAYGEKVIFKGGTSWERRCSSYPEAGRCGARLRCAAKSCSAPLPGVARAQSHRSSTRFYARSRGRGGAGHH